MIEEHFKFDVMDNIKFITDNQVNIEYVTSYDNLCKVFDFEGLKQSNQESNFSDYNKSDKNNFLLIFDLSNYNQMTLLEQIEKAVKSSKFSDEYKNLLNDTKIVYCDKYETFLMVMKETSIFKNYVRIGFNNDFDSFEKKYGNVIPTLIYQTNKPDDIIIDMESFFNTLKSDNFLDMLDEICYENGRI